jgi:hypothetical protein
MNSSVSHNFPSTGNHTLKEEIDAPWLESTATPSFTNPTLLHDQ